MPEPLTVRAVLVTAVTLLIAVVAAAHVVLYKRDSRAAAAWVGLIVLVPLLGSLLYLLFGINRIRRKAVALRTIRTGTTGEFEWSTLPPGESPPASAVGHLAPLAELVGRVAGRPLTAGNRIASLVNGDMAYPAMLEAIDGARRSVALATYIFDNDAAGRLFADALERAVKRGVEVRVLIDAVGARYSWPFPIARELARRSIRIARFGVTLLPWRMPYMNLRSHRKILVADGTIGFTGGMNIRAGCLLERRPRRPIQDLHFRLEGPVVRQLMQVFAEDWVSTTKEQLRGDAWFPHLEPRGRAFARGITDGPDADLDKARFVFLGALACAQSSVRIVTPYFLPDAGLIGALDVAALRGVRVDIVLPDRSNLALVQWAAQAQLWQVLKRGCHVYATPPPFDHSKVMLVDNTWALFGSSNWDPRSLRLNFELDVECYEEALVGELERFVDARIHGAQRITAADVNRRSLPVRLRDGIARLAAPYL